MLFRSVSVYRLHSLIPDDIKFYDLQSGEHRCTLPMVEVAFERARNAVGWVQLLRIDAASDRARRRGRRGLAGLLLTLLTGACRPAHTTPPGPAEIATLDCGGRTCSIGQAGPSTIVWVSE